MKTCHKGYSEAIVPSFITQDSGLRTNLVGRHSIYIHSSICELETEADYISAHIIKLSYKMLSPENNSGYDVKFTETR